MRKADTAMGERPPSYMSCATLARELDVCESTVAAMVQRGVIPKPLKLSPGCVRWCWADVQSALATLSGPVPDDADPFMVGLRRVLPTEAGKKQADRSGTGRLDMRSIPATLSHAELMREMEAEKERWRASIPGSPLYKREKDALLRAVAQRMHAGQSIPFRDFRLGQTTGERLEARGFLEFKKSVGYVFTQAGINAANDLAAGR